MNVVDRIARAAGEGPERRRIEAGGESRIIGGCNLGMVVVTVVECGGASSILG